MFEAKVLADSVSPSGIRLTTFQATFPRMNQAEAKTHAQVRGNASSTRAIPLKDQLRILLDDAYVPDAFGTNKPGMQPGAPLTGDKKAQAQEIWLKGRDRAATTSIELMLGEELAGEILEYDPKTGFADGRLIVRKLDEIVSLIPVSEKGVMPDLTDSPILNVGKELANRWLETPMWITNIFTATEYDHFLNLRDHPDAQGEIRTIARMMREARDASTPRELDYGQWHTPLVADDEFESADDRLKASAARCAAVSYNRQNAPSSYESLMKRYWILVNGRHMSPLEHQARPFSREEWMVRQAGRTAVASSARANGLSKNTTDQILRSLEFNGPFRGWHQFRKDIEGEHLFQG